MEEDVADGVVGVVASAVLVETAVAIAAAVEEEALVVPEAWVGSPGRQRLALMMNPTSHPLSSRLLNQASKLKVWQIKLLELTPSF